MPATAVGMVECRGMVAAMVALEGMCKAADVTCVVVERVSSGVLVVVVKGDLASVQHAVDAGTEAVAGFGDLRNARVYAHPTSEVVGMLGASIDLTGDRGD